MSRPPGLPKTGGRTKGTPNRRSGILVEELHHLGLHPVEELVKTLPQLNPETRARILLSFMGFLYPKKVASGATLEEAVALNNIRKEAEETNELSIDSNAKEHPADTWPT
jgi:hypothetical protein